MDAQAYPRTTSYLRRLPAGLLSHPQCESKASLYREAVRNLPRPLALDELDPLEVFQRCLDAHEVTADDRPALEMAYREVISELQHADSQAE